MEIPENTISWIVMLEDHSPNIAPESRAIITVEQGNIMDEAAAG